MSWVIDGNNLLGRAGASRDAADTKRQLVRSLANFARATLAYAEGDRASFARMRRRAENYDKEMPYGFVRIFRLDSLA